MKTLLVICVVMMLLVLGCSRSAKTVPATLTLAPTSSGTDISSASQTDKELATDDANAAANDLGQITW